MTIFSKTDSTIQLRENNESKPNVILSLNLDMYKRQCLSVCHLICLSARSVVVQLNHVLTWNAADSALIAQTSPHSNVLMVFFIELRSISDKKSKWSLIYWNKKKQNNWHRTELNFPLSFLSSPSALKILLASSIS